MSSPINAFGTVLSVKSCKSSFQPQCGQCEAAEGIEGLLKCIRYKYMLTQKHLVLRLDVTVEDKGLSQRFHRGF